jgi:alpha-tubulin suppressor-like RCC1 family protein
VRRDDRRALCWGTLQGGDGSSNPVPVLISDLNVQKVVAGTSSSCAMAVDGRAYCWGTALPIDGIGRNSLPQQVDLLINVDTLVTTRDGSCWRLRSGVVNCSNTASPNPDGFLIPGAVRAIDGTLTPDANHYCAVTQDPQNSQLGGVVCWGDDAYVTAFLGVSLDLEVGATQVAVGDSHTCALVSTQVLCWGDNSVGQVGFGGLPQAGGSNLSPTQVMGSLSALAIDAAANTTCAVLEDRTLSCWGALGVNPQPAPFPIPGLTNVASVSVGANSVCVVTLDGKLWCFGDNALGQLGTSPAADLPILREGVFGPVQVLLPEPPPG